MIGTNVAHYEIRERLGAGGMGVVYKAWDTRLDRWVALKFLPQHADDDPTARERFVREAKAASALEHPHICTIHEVGETDDGQLFICMAYYAGPNLRKVIRSGNLTTARALEIARQIASALGRAHQEGIVHRDLKPSNIMTTVQGDVAIVDFGLAKLTGQDSITKTGATMGTVAYMSPEQIRGMDLDARTDLWSFGVILHELLTSKHPFRGDYDEARRRSILEDEVSPPSLLKPAIPPHVDEVVQRLLQKDRTRRTASAGEVDQMLVGSSASSMDSRVDTKLATPRPPNRSAKKTRGRRKTWWAATGGATLLIGALVALSQLTCPGGLRRSVDLAVLPFENETADPARDYLARGLSFALIDELGAAEGMRVISRDKVTAPEIEGLEPASAGKRLGVDFVLTGAVQTAHGATYVAASLVDTSTAMVILSDSLEVHENELQTVQRQLVGRVLRSLEKAGSTSAASTESLEAYDLFLRAQDRLGEVQDPTSRDSAVALLRETLRHDPNFALAHAMLSEALADSHGNDADVLGEAEDAARKAIELDPSLPAAHIALARVYRDTDRNELAIEELNRLVAMRPDLDLAFMQLAMSYEHDDEFSKAETAYRKAIAIRPDNWQHWNNLGTLLWDLGELDGAREAFRQAMTLTPAGTTWPQENLAGLELSVGNPEQALEVYEQLPRPIVDALLASDIGTAYYFLERFEDAEPYYRMAIRLDPDDQTLQANMADLLLRLNRQEEAREHYRNAHAICIRALELDPSNTRMQVRAWLYLAKAGDCELALAQIRGSSQDEVAQTARNAHDIARSYAACGEQEAALDLIERALELGRPAQSIAIDDTFRQLADDPAFLELVDSGSDPGL